MKIVWSVIKHSLWWVLPLFALSLYFGWKLGEAVRIIRKLGEGL